MKNTEWNPENVPASKLPKGYRFLRVGESIRKGKTFWCFFLDHSLCGLDGNKMPNKADVLRPWTELQRRGFTYAVPIENKKPRKAPAKRWIPFSERQPTEKDLPISCCIEGNKTDMGVYSNLPTQGHSLTHWLPRRVPPIPAPEKPKDEFEEWWAAQGFRRGKKEAKAAFEAGKNKEYNDLAMQA